MKKSTTYILTKQVHFGSLKSSLVKGSKFNVNENNGKIETADFSGRKITNISELNAVIKAGFAVPFVEGKTNVKNDVKIMPKAEKNNKKYPVIKSEDDSTKEIIDISHTKTSVIKERIAEARKKNMELAGKNQEDVKTIRGMKLVDGDKNIINIGSEKELFAVIADNDVKVIKDISNIAKAAEATPAEKTSFKVVKSVTKQKDGKVSSKAAENRANRKKQAEANRAKAKTEATAKAEVVATEGSETK